MTDDSFELKAHPQYGFLQIKPTPSADEIAKFYANEFYSGDYKKLNDSSLETQMEDAPYYNGHWDDLCAGMEEVLKANLENKKILDVGCGWGQALLYFRSKGMKCFGFDPAPEAISYGQKQGLELKVAGFEKMDVFPGDFDIVTLINVLEHLADPVHVITEIKEKVLKPGGLLVIDVPNEFNTFQVAGQKLNGLKEWWVSPPAHLNYFNRDTLTKTLEGAGYKVKLAEASFPLEMFLLFGRNYVKDPILGKACHKERVAFETNLRKLGQVNTLRKFYRELAKINLGRQVAVFATT